jgi:hypothetical protein
MKTQCESSILIQKGLALWTRWPWADGAQAREKI